jgi:hypothetical protein
MKLSDLVVLENKQNGNFNVKVRLSGADLNQIGNSLSYKVSNVVLETRNGAIEVPMAGIVSLNITPESLVTNLLDHTEGEVIEILNVKLSESPTDFKLGSNKANYSLTVDYADENGETKRTELDFNDIDFSPSPQFTEKTQELT